MSNGGGNFDRMSAASSSITSADDFPPPPVWRGRVNKMLSNNWRDWEKDREIYAQELNGDEFTVKQTLRYSTTDSEN